MVVGVICSGKGFLTFVRMSWVELALQPLRAIGDHNMLAFCRYEIDKVTAGQRLDLNLERG